MADPTTQQYLIRIRNEEMEVLRYALQALVTNPDQKVSERELNILNQRFVQWEALSRGLETNPAYWDRNLPEEVKANYKKAKHMLTLVSRLFGPQQGS